MQFNIKKRDELARIGEILLDDKRVETPTILSINTNRFKAFDKADVILSNNKIKTDKVVLNFPQIPLKLDKQHFYHLDEETGIVIVKYASQLFEKSKNFVDLIINLRKKIGSEKIIYTPAIAVPSNLALLCYMGIDFFDTTSTIIAARNKTMFFSDGQYKTEDLTELPCNCPICNSVNKKALELSFEEILNHNYYMLFNELKQVRNMIKTGNLRNYVEKKVQTNPLYITILRNLDMNYYDFLEEQTPVVSNKIIYATCKESFNRSEIRRFQERVINRYNKPDTTKILLLLPCSAKKPYSFSKTHKFLRRAILETSNPDIIHEVIITSPLGLVPRELELVYPAANYDIPVTGVWDEDEKKMIKTLLKDYLAKNKYEKIIIHLPDEITSFIKDDFKKAVFTCIDRPTSDESLEKLKNTLQESMLGFKKIDRNQRIKQNIESLACYQFGKKSAKTLLENTKIFGKYPNLKITQDGKQIGMLTGDRGFISLTLEGAKKIKSFDCYNVEIADDFKPKGSILAPGVLNADENIRIGDEVLIFRKKSLVGIGAAVMNGSDMKKNSFGEAVKIRHIL
jgi:archaeosine synthase alpha-subunit